MHTMKGTIEFDLNEPEEMEAMLRFIKSVDMALALDDIRNYVGKLFNDHDDEDTIAIKEVYDKIFGVFDHRDVYPDDLIS